MTAVAVHHVVDGPPDAPVLVLSNSLGTRLGMWDAQVPELARRFLVVRYDHRGHGESPVPPGPYDIADLGGDVLALLDRLGIERAHVCGASLGGQVAMWLGAHAPDRVNRLVLCCTSAWFGPPDPWMERAALVRANGSGSVASTVIGRWFTPEFAQRNPAEFARMRDMIAATPAEGYASCCEVVGRTDLRPDLADIRASTLVIAGADDPAAPPEEASRIAAGIPEARVAVVADAAHLANIQQADEVTRLILHHLAGTTHEEES